MAALTPNQMALQWSSGVADLAALVAVRNVTAGDTADLASWFSKVDRAVVQMTTDTSQGTGSVSGTTVTIPSGPAGSSGYLLAYGSISTA